MNQEIDFSECEREQLRTLGFIQSHGCLLAFGPDQKVSHASANTSHSFGRAPEEILHRDIRGFCSEENAAALERLLPFLREGRVEKLNWHHSSQPLVGWLHLHQGVYVLELESSGFTAQIEPEAATATMEAFLESASHATNVQTLAQQAADAFADIAGYDRVMVYRFQEDWSGQVIAERRTPAVEPFLGLHYPATDIPSQARQLYSLNLLRVLQDVHSVPVAILAAPSSGPLDLTYGILRSMSEYHIEYLRNLNVGATLTASLMVDGRLWGMMACHHLTSKAAPVWVRDAAKLIGTTVSTRLAALETRNAQRARDKLERQIKALADDFTSAEKIVEGLCFGPTRLHTLFELDSAAIYTDEACITVGNAPPAEWIQSFVHKLLPLGQDIFSFSENLGGLSCDPSDEAMGAVALVLTREPPAVVLGFRAELEQELSWGGDVQQAAIKEPGAPRLSPRKSFAAYKQSIRSTSLPWSANETELARSMLPIMRQLLPSNQRDAVSTITKSIRRFSDAAAGPSSLFRPLLDFVAEGMSLFVTHTGGLATPAFASKALLNHFNLDDSGPEFLLTLGDFFRHIGMPEDLLNRAHFGPQEVQVITGRCANRTYLVQLKQILEVTTGESRAFLAVLTFSNMTRQARLLEMTEASRKRAEHANQIKSSFLANTTHEVRTPMNGILGMAHLLKDTGLTAAQTELVEMIERSGKALLQVVNDILDFSKIEAGKLTLESVPLNLHLLLQDVVRLFRPMTASQVELSLEIDAEVPAFLIGDPGRLRQVVLNLLGNAIKFTHQGQVALRVHVESVSTIYVGLYFEVADTGIGMAPEKAARLFERFDQADASISRKYGGTGLGLSISKELVTLMGGYIAATSTPGEGTTLQFRLTFLVDRPHSAEKSETPKISLNETSDLRALALASSNSTSAPEANGRRQVRVLLVDDNAVNLKVAKAMLARDGYAVTVAWNGAEAVELSRQNEYDVIFMDCQMPEMDGFEASALIRKREAGRRRTPIIALTAGMINDEQDSCFSAGMDDFLPKPIDPAKLRMLVQRWITPANEAVPVGNQPELRA